MLEHLRHRPRIHADQRPRVEPVGLRSLARRGQEAVRLLGPRRSRRGAARQSLIGAVIGLPIHAAPESLTMASVTDLSHHDVEAHHEHHLPSGWRRFLYSTNHKDIGTLYLAFAICAGLIGTIFWFIFGAELLEPG